ncbi:hypothetical protein H4R34_003796 [Dimargaris verticillata]|uniref:Uncharacterized protein n=1 Tax=Dimargaris verticillata TaxID=2761393 RepID=A0A9W8B1N0_9FUNG|nr:hypothetical protein H4R34_003796 [Dimargaris verticillata]
MIQPKSPAVKCTFALAANEATLHHATRITLKNAWGCPVAGNPEVVKNYGMVLLEHTCQNQQGTTVYHSDDKDLLSEDGSKILLNGTVDRKRKYNGTKDPNSASLKIKKSRSGSAKASPLLRASKANGSETTEVLANGLVPTMKSLTKPDQVHATHVYPAVKMPHFENANPNDSDAGYIDVEDSEDLEEFFQDLTALNGD